MTLPVLLLIFNRPDLTKQVLERIRQAKPRHLFIAADGPRADYSSDAELCREARAVAEEVDWDCEVQTLFQTDNLGCKYGPTTGIDWFFGQVEEGIILEDDCVPDPSFFRYCKELLEKYRNDERIMVISGNNFQGGRRRTSYSYYFSRYSHTWGWATWRRAWQHYDSEIGHWPALRNTRWLFDIMGDEEAASHWKMIFDRVYEGQFESAWDYPWSFACWSHNGLTVLPEVNLVSNVGFGEDATHTKSTDDRFSRLPTYPMQFPLRHPPYVARNREADQFTFSSVFQKKKRSTVKRVFSRFFSLIPDSIKRQVVQKLRIIVHSI